MAIRKMEWEAFQWKRGNTGAIDKPADSHNFSVTFSPETEEFGKEVFLRKDKAYNDPGNGNKVAMIGAASPITGPSTVLQRMEEKAQLMKRMAGVEGIPMCLNLSDMEQTLSLVKALESSFGGFLLVGTAGFDSYTFEKRIKNEGAIPVLRDEEDGTAIVILAGLINSFKVTGKPMHKARIVVHGEWNLGVSVSMLLRWGGIKDVIFCPTMNGGCPEAAGKHSYPWKTSSDVKSSLQGADMLICLHAEEKITADMLRSMNNDPVVFALSEPYPNLLPEEAIAAGARIVATRSPDYPNQIHNVLAIPGIFRGVLDVQATMINKEMKLAVARAIADQVEERELGPCHILPSMDDDRVVSAVAGAVAQAAVETGVWTLIRGSSGLIS